MWEKALILDQPGDALWRVQLSGFSVWKETGSVDVVVLAPKATLITTCFRSNCSCSFLLCWCFLIFTVQKQATVFLVSFPSYIDVNKHNVIMPAIDIFCFLFLSTYILGYNHTDDYIIMSYNYFVSLSVIRLLQLYSPWPSSFFSLPITISI